ncbi:hypothetical protein ATDW_36500 (plasmid) [Asticcacaulis sp. DW145]|uniref:hypothetical protein n=1 Tax=Asticcacaulis sp. DW145 TaxID=3095608 RepID=UPI0030921212|nr:hypothetical protein ATDW_36500 [Asticcacaulis sp. DW145]
MNKPFEPNHQYFMIRWDELEMAWRMLATPDKLHRVEDTLETVMTLERMYGPEKAVFNMVAATAWLTDDGPCSRDGWKP